MPSRCCSYQELRRRPPQHLEGRHRDFPHWEVRQFPYRETLTGTCSTGLLRNLLLCLGLSQLLPHEEVDIVPSLKLSSVCLNNETHQKFLQHRRSDIGILLVRRSPRRSTWTFSKAVQCVSPQRDAPLVPTLTGNAISSSTFRRSDIGTFQTRGGPPSIPRTRQPGPSSSAGKSCLLPSVTLPFSQLHYG